MGNDLTPTSRTATTKPPSLPSWVTSFEAWQKPSVPRKTILEQIQSLKPWLEPAGSKAFAVAMAKLFEFARTFNIQFNSSKATEVYREALASLPADLLNLAIQRIMVEWRWGNRLPMPADIRGTVREDWARRNNEMFKLRVAERNARPAKRMPSLAEQIDARISA